jgi:hypothetical protein
MAQQQNCSLPLPNQIDGHVLDPLPAGAFLLFLSTMFYFCAGGHSCAKPRSQGEGRGGRRLRDQRPCAAFSTSATWPGILTLCQTPRTTPPLSMRKVLRSMPMYLRPYMLFSTHTP